MKKKIRKAYYKRFKKIIDKKFLQLPSAVCLLIFSVIQLETLAFYMFQRKTFHIVFLKGEELCFSMETIGIM